VSSLHRVFSYHRTCFADIRLFLTNLFLKIWCICVGLIKFATWISVVNLKLIFFFSLSTYCLPRQKMIAFIWFIWWLFWETVVILELILFLLSSYCLSSTKWFTPYCLFNGCFATWTSVVEVIFSFPKHLLPSSPKNDYLLIWWLFWYLDNCSNFWYIWDSNIVPEKRKVRM